jgi:hypothetical protein
VKKEGKEDGGARLRKHRSEERRKGRNGSKIKGNAGVKKEGKEDRLSKEGREGNTTQPVANSEV